MWGVVVVAWPSIIGLCIRPFSLSQTWAIFTKLNIQAMWWGVVVVAKFVGHPLLVDFHPTCVCNHPAWTALGELPACLQLLQIEIYK